MRNQKRKLVFAKVELMLIFLVEIWLERCKILSLKNLPWTKGEPTM